MDNTLYSLHFSHIRLRRPSIELRSTNGGDPYIDFSNDSSVDYDARIALTDNDTLTLSGTHLSTGGNNIIDIGSLEGNFGNIAKSTDEWLRLNDGSTHTLGVYIPNLLQIGSLQNNGAGSFGGAIDMNSNAINEVGSISMTGSIDMNNNSVSEISYLYGQYGHIARSTDEYLRLNDDGSHTSGVYIASPGLLMGGPVDMNGQLLSTVGMSGNIDMNNYSINEINLLGEIDNLGKKYISKQHNIDTTQIRSYVHYRPSFWHLHIHFDMVNTFNSFSNLDICHLIHNIVSNLKVDGNYYKKAILLTYQL